MIRRLLGHRGASARTPENTATALRAALQDGADGLEFDVRCLGDGTPVLMHDANVDRTTDGTGPLADFDRRSIARLDAGSRKNRDFAGERVPLLEDVLAEFLGRAYLAIEMKEILPEEVLRTIGDAVRANVAADAVLASFEAKALERARDVVPALHRSLILGRETPFPPPELATYLGLSGMFAPHDRIDERFVVECRRLGLSLFAYTVNDPGRAELLLALGVEGIISDDPRALRPHFPAAG
ncbi:MAG: glycerophosphoryl diester phosphodiesterase [Gemmatimonadetes bacterium]|nr:glycerophosphoryl diester phosphodiesterase [Gemmatimonadota bacterium]